MSTFNDNIRRELGFGLISWNTQEHRQTVVLSRPQIATPTRQTESVDTTSPTRTHPRRLVASGGE